MFLKLTLSGTGTGTEAEIEHVHVRMESITTMQRLPAWGDTPARTWLDGRDMVEETPEAIEAMISCAKDGDHVYEQLCRLIHHMDELAISMEASHRSGHTLSYGKARKHITGLLDQLEAILNHEVSDGKL